MTFRREQPKGCTLELVLYTSDFGSKFVMEEFAIDLNPSATVQLEQAALVDRSQQARRAGREFGRCLTGVRKLS